MKKILKTKNIGKIFYQKHLMKKEFTNFYKSNGYNLVEPLPLKIEFDPTLEFASCTICLLKKLLIENKFLKSFVTIQPALRTNTYKEIFSSKEMVWNSELTMIGGFVTINERHKNFNVIMKEQLLFLHKVLGNKNFYINITVHKNLVNKNIFDFNQNEIGKIANFKFNDDPRLKWDYGYKNLSGIGTRWEIVNRNTKQRYNYGNVIAVFIDNELVGYEFGGGLEVLIQAKISSARKVYICDSFCNIFLKDVNKIDNIKLMDACITINKVLSQVSLSQASESLKYTVSLYFIAIFEILEKWRIGYDSFCQYLSYFPKRNSKLIKRFNDWHNYYKYLYQQNMKGIRKWKNKI